MSLVVLVSLAMMLVVPFLSSFVHAVVGCDVVGRCVTFTIYACSSRNTSSTRSDNSSCNSRSSSSSSRGSGSCSSSDAGGAGDDPRHFLGQLNHKHRKSH